MAQLKLKNVRLSFPSVFQRAKFNEVETKYEATFLLDKKKNRKEIQEIEEAIDAAIKEANIKVPSDKRALRDGEDSEYDGYEGCMSFKSSSNKRPIVIDRDKSPLIEEDNKIYAGCYVNAIVDIWVQNNNYGKRVNGNLYGIQFVKDGEAFGSGPTDVGDNFDDLDELD